MKRLMVCLLMVASVCLAYADAAQTPAKKHRLTAEERRARRDARVAAEGGLVSRPIDGRVVRVLSRTDKVSMAELEEFAKSVRMLLGYVVEIVESETASHQKTGCLIVLAEQDNAPTILVAPEDPWASVNVKNLMKDKPDHELLKTRVIKELWRAFAYALGAANSNMQPCLMRPIFSLKDLDSEKVAILSPEPLAGISQTAQRLNFAQASEVTYKKACEEGWASAPTNDLQKAIWDKVHTLPTEPLKLTK